MHGHTLWNIRRGKHEMPWKRTLTDVADKLKPGWGWSDCLMGGAHSEAQVEAMVLSYFDERAKTVWTAMTNEQCAKLATSLDEELVDVNFHIGKTVKIASAKSITVALQGFGISAGLLMGTGVVTLAQGVGSFALGGALGGTLPVARGATVWRLERRATGGQWRRRGSGQELVFGAAAVAFAANAMMSTSYRKTIPATLRLLTAHQLRSLLCPVHRPLHQQGPGRHEPPRVRCNLWTLGIQHRLCPPRRRRRTAGSSASTGASATWFSKPVSRQPPSWKTL